MWSAAQLGEMRNAYKIFIKRPNNKTTLGRPRQRWEDIKMDLKNGEGGCELDSCGSE
jgi:hypothetical protein